MPLDLRLIGRRDDTAHLARILLPVAITGFVIAVIAGALLFITAAADYAASSFFLAKLAVIALALVNALALRRRSGPASWPAWAGAASILLWLTAIILGRLIGYF